jgi:hypothetical protein
VPTTGPAAAAGLSPVYGVQLAAAALTHQRSPGSQQTTAHTHGCCCCVAVLPLLALNEQPSDKQRQRKQTSICCLSIWGCHTAAVAAAATAL